MFVAMKATPEAELLPAMTRTVLKVDKSRVFADGKALTAYVKDVALSQSKKIKVVGGSGQAKSFVCVDEKCTWRVDCNCKGRSRSTGVFVDRGIQLPPGTWYIRAVMDEHIAGCTSDAVPSERQVSVLPGFRSAVGSGVRASRRQIDHSVRVVDNIDLSSRPSVVYRAQQKVYEAN